MAKTNNQNRQKKPKLAKKQIRAMLRSIQEHKVINVVSSGTTATAGVVSYQSIIAQGSDLTNRIADKITTVGMTWDFGILDSSASLTRVILFTDSMCLGAAPAVTDVISSAAYYSQILPIAVQQNRYKIIYDDVITTSLGAGIASHHGMRFTKKFVTNFIGTTAAVGSGGKGALFLLVLSTGTTCAYDSSLQIRYIDG